MELSQLTAYAKEKYAITEEFKWESFKGFSVLSHPATGKWAALLMRLWDGDRGEMIERCDIKCGREAVENTCAPYLSPPFRVQGEKWVGVRFDEQTEEAVVFRLFDRAVAETGGHGATIVLANELPSKQRCRETALPVRSVISAPSSEKIPQRIQEMTALYEFGDGSMRQKAKSFVIQAKFMEDYEDDAPWYGEFRRYFTTYHDLRLAQLRGYFTWRTSVRKGIFQPIAPSLAYIYIYELLNGVGADSPEDSLKKMKEFETGFLDAGYGDSGMKHNLHQWMTAFAVIKGVELAIARPYFDETELARDRALSVLAQPDAFGDSEVFDALCRIAAVKLMKSPVITKHGEEGKRLFARLWRHMLINVTDFFHLCFGTQRELQWYPLCNAVYWQPEPYPDAVYILSDNHRFICRDGVWVEHLFPELYFDKEKINGLVREADRLFRIYLKTGRPLQQKSSEAWATPYIDAVTEADRQEKIAAATPKITIRFCQLEQIRQEASVTRDSLLTEEELREAETEEQEPTPAPTDDSLLSPLSLQIMRLLLSGGDVKPLLAQHRLMPSLVADEINEALWEEIGDTVLTCDGDRLALVEDYTDEIRELLGG